MRTPREDFRRFKIALWIAIAVIVACFTITFPWGRESPVPLLLGLLALGAAVTIPIVLGRKRRSFMAAWLAAYTLAYCILSWRGGYIDANLGGNDNRSIWYPAYCGEAFWSRAGRQKSMLRPLGWFFLPLVMIDRALVHRTHFDAF